MEDVGTLSSRASFSLRDDSLNEKHHLTFVSLCGARGAWYFVIFLWVQLMYSCLVEVLLYSRGGIGSHSSGGGILTHSEEMQTL